MINYIITNTGYFFKTMHVKLSRIKLFTTSDAQVLAVKLLVLQLKPL